MLRFTYQDEEPARLDSFLASKVTTLSRSSIQKLIDNGDVLVDGNAVKSKHKIKYGQRITIDFDPKQLDEIPDIDLPILYEDTDCIVINKPTGILTHSKGMFNPEGTVATFIRRKLDNFDGDRAGIVHRLDRGTSGVIICAKNEKASLWLQKQFSSRKAKKTYLALIEKPLDPNEAIVDAPIERNPKKPQTFRVGANGKAAITQYKVLKETPGKVLVELKPTTGRTHQLRVHLKSMGQPIIGDEFYDGKPAKRLMLHAWKLEITLPSGELKAFESPIPKQFQV